MSKSSGLMDHEIRPLNQRLSSYRDDRFLSTSEYRMQLLSKIIILIFVTISLFSGYSGISQAHAEPPQNKMTPVDELQRVAHNYQIEILTSNLDLPLKTTHGLIEGKAAAEQQLLAYQPLFVQEFSLYPPKLIRLAKLKRVVFCDELSFAGQRRNAVPDFEHDTLYLDIVPGVENSLYMRKVLHHDVYHMIDYRDDGRLYNDDRWLLLNPPQFQYSRGGGKSVQDLAETSVFTDNCPGFLNHYSTMGVEEDKAEIFAHMLVEGSYVSRRAARDDVLAAKVERMKELLEKFCPEMNSEFWKKVEKAEQDYQKR